MGPVNDTEAALPTARPLQQGKAGFILPHRSGRTQPKLSESAMTTGPNKSGIPPYRDVPTTPFVYFDFVPVYGVRNGVIQIELAAQSLIPRPSEGSPEIEIVPVTRLRCSIVALQSLQDAITKLTELMENAEQKATLANIRATGKVN
jgi:hypothetical protein